MANEQYNDYQRANMMLDSLLGAQARAVWLCARVDGTPVHVIAAEQELSIGAVRDMLATADWILDRLAIVPPEPAKPPLRPCLGGFHQIGDGE